MKISQNGIDLIKRFEGFYPTAYKCPAGVLTIGYGHTATVTPNMVVTRNEAEELLRRDLVEAEHAVRTHVNRPIGQHQFDALVSFVFNLGAGAFARSTLLKRVNEMRDDYAAMEFLRWNKADGKVLAGLERRRQAESDMYLELPWLSD